VVIRDDRCESNGGRRAAMSEDDKGGRGKVVEVLLTSPNLILVLGGIFVVLGASGGVTYQGWFPIADEIWRLLLVAVGITLLGLYFLLPKDSARKLSDRTIKSLGIKIEYPESNAVITGKTEVRGTIAKPLPEGYELCILRGYPAGGYIPHGYCVCDPDKKTWYVAQFDIGGEKNDSRRIEAWLVGPDGRLLLDTWLAAHEVHRASNSRLQELASAERPTWLKPIAKATSDMYRCDWIKVTRG
jgi:hypothetical protein